MATAIDSKLNSIVEILKTEYNPIRLFLFGSRAANNAHIDSDYDFAMIVQNDNFSRHRSISKARGLLHEKCQISADVFFYSQKEFDDWKDELTPTRAERGPILRVSYTRFEFLLSKN